MDGINPPDGIIHDLFSSEANPAPNRPRVKICGITNPDDAGLAVALGADALGFIFYPPSPRAVTPATTRAIIATLPPGVTPVAVLVRETGDTIAEIMAASGCRVAQVHGATPSLVAALAWPVYPAIAVAEAADLEALAAYPETQAVLLDTKVAGHVGGTGQSFDWRLARRAGEGGRRVILAGGLSPENIGEAIRIARPYAVDVNSGVESAPGRKDHARLRALFAVLNHSPAG